jgi:hypothetical protein
MRDIYLILKGEPDTNRYGSFRYSPHSYVYTHVDAMKVLNKKEKVRNEDGEEAPLYEIKSLKHHLL